MSNVSVDKITIILDVNEAIDVGHSILRSLEDTKRGGYPIESNHPGMLNLCKQLLNTAYGYDYSKEIDRKINEASSAADSTKDES